MTKKEIFRVVDKTNLKQTATRDDIDRLCSEAIRDGYASVCVAPCYVEQAREYIDGVFENISDRGDKPKVCTVIGFPNGNTTTEVKIFETANAIVNGADEIDMVINIGMVKEGNRYNDVVDEINKVKAVCGGKILKVIVETCLLTEDEKVNICHAVINSNADYIKTSTGFSTGGATVEDVKLFRQIIDVRRPTLKIKAAGGIRTLEAAEAMIKAGADRIGASNLGE